jgi:hypothetical protein
MGAIDARLDRGVTLFRRAGDDAALLGAALLAFHGALERFLDDELAGQATVGDQERALIERGRLGWPDRVELAVGSGLLTPAARDQAIRATRARLAIARGDEHGWSAEDVGAYGRLVAERCGRRELVAKIDQRAERARATAAHQAPPAWPEPQERARISPIRLGITVLFLAVLGISGWVIYNQIEGNRLLRAVGVLPAPTAAPAPTALAPTPTPTRPAAKMVGLGEGPGWLHVTPSFDSPTRAIRLAEGMEVAPRDERQVDPNGVTWRLVEVGGYEGWVPESNLAIEGR